MCLSWRPKKNASDSVFEWGSLEILRGPCLSGFCIPDGLFLSPETFPLRWDRLTTLALTGLLSSSQWDPLAGVTTDAILDAISRCPQLRSCTLAVSDASPIDTHPEDLAIDLAFLHTLEIYCIGNITHTISNLLQRLSVPALRKFLFRGRRGVPSDRSLAPFVSLATQLEDFDLDGEIFSRADFLQTLRSLPATVKRLVIGPPADSPLSPPSNPFDDDILALLTPSVDSPAVCCPVLRTLIVQYGGLISDAALLQFITARRNAGTLQRVAVEFHRTRTLELDRLLAPLIQTGLAVSIIHYPIRMFSRDFSPWNGIYDDVTESFEPAVIGLPYGLFRLANW